MPGFLHAQPASTICIQDPQAASNTRAAARRSEHIPFLLTPTFLRVLVNSFSKADTHLHSAARRLIEQLARHAESSPDATLRVAAAVALQRQRGGGFDRLTKTKYASNLLKVSSRLCMLCIVSLSCAMLHSMYSWEACHSKHQGKHQASYFQVMP